MKFNKDFISILKEIYQTTPEYTLVINSTEFLLPQKTKLKYNFEGINTKICKYLPKEVAISLNYLYELCEPFLKLHTKITIKKQIWINAFLLCAMEFSKRAYNILDIEIENYDFFKHIEKTNIVLNNDNSGYFLIFYKIDDYYDQTNVYKYYRNPEDYPFVETGLLFQNIEYFSNKTINLDYEKNYDNYGEEDDDDEDVYDEGVIGDEDMYEEDILDDDFNENLDFTNYQDENYKFLENDEHEF